MIRSTNQTYDSFYSRFVFCYTYSRKMMFLLCSGVGFTICRAFTRLREGSLRRFPDPSYCSSCAILKGCSATTTRYVGRSLLRTNTNYCRQIFVFAESVIAFLNVGILLEWSISVFAFAERASIFARSVVWRTASASWLSCVLPPRVGFDRQRSSPCYRSFFLSRCGCENRAAVSISACWPGAQSTLHHGRDRVNKQYNS